MKKKKKNVWERYNKNIKKYGNDIMLSPNFKKSAKYIQHGNTSIKKHSLFVAMTAMQIGKTLPIKMNEEDLIRGALLHDYFQYDWHNPPKKPKGIMQFYKKHGFTHPGIACENAEKEFYLNDRQRDIIRKHMWPLTIKPPACREAWVVTAADKYCSLLETLKVVK